jgi:flagellar export protein FliJ
MAFRFKLEVPLKVRRIQEDLARQGFAQAQRQLTSLVSMKEQVRARKSLFTAELLTAMSEGLGAFEVKVRYDYLSHLDETLARIDAAIKKAELLLEEERGRLLKAKKAHKAIQRLREIHLARYTDAQNKEEMGFIDEIAVMNAGGTR